MPSSTQSFFTSVLEQLLGLFVQIFIISSLVFASFLLSFYLREQNTGQVLLTQTVWEMIIAWSAMVGIVATVSYKIGRLSLIRVFLFFLPKKKTNEKANPLVVFLLSLFLATAFIVSTQPLRPVLQHTQISESDPYVDVAYVRYDLIPSLVILVVLAIPTIIIAKKKQTTPEFFTTTALIIFFGGLALYTNQTPNFLARVYESREAWILRDWNSQANRAEKALRDAQTPEEKATALYWLGVAANRNKEYQQAVEYQLEAITTQPDYGAPYSSVSSAYRALGNYSLAVDYAEECIARAPDYAWCYYALGAVQTEIGQWDAAVENFSLATQLDSRDQELKAALTTTVDRIQQMDANDRAYASSLPPGCLTEPIVDASGQRCDGKNVAKRFSYTSTSDCLEISNTNCRGAGVMIENNCSADKQVFFDNEPIAAGETKIFQLSEPGSEKIVYGVGSMDNDFFTVSYTQTENLCR